MRIKKTHESGSLMVEVIAVLALLGVMGTMMFRQVQRRNEELDNINMASEIRMIKEATTAYIQANRSALEADAAHCDPSVIDPPNAGVDTTELPLDAVEKFLPDNWISDTDAQNGIIHEYKIYLSCYRINSPAADNRIALYGTIVPNDPNSETESSPLPPNFTLRRAARVATLIGADGGVHEAGGDEFVGAMGAWQIGCGKDDDGTCEDRNDNFYVATTGMDIYVPEADKTADNTVSVPRKIAFEDLHATDYFSVGDGSNNCVQNYDSTNDQFAHENLGTGPLPNQAAEDVIRDPWADNCAPLFWVGRDDNAGHVYVKNNLYIGRDANNRQAVSIETGSHDRDRTITVHDSFGNDTITLNGAGEIVGRVNSTGKGYRLDAANGEIVLFEEAAVNINGTNRTIQVPTMRLKDGRMETNVTAQYYDDNGVAQTAVYAVDPAGESLMHDIRLTARGGARLSEILSNYILKSTQTLTQADESANPVQKPTCPTGYAAAITVTPIRFSQYVKQATVRLDGVTGGINGTSDNHYHTVWMPETTANAEGNAHRILLNPGNSDYFNLEMIQKEAVNISIVSEDDSWNVSLTYGNDAPTADDPITALAQTYCVFEDTERSLSHTNSIQEGDEIQESGLRIDSKKAGIISEPRSSRSCSHDYECANTETCTSSTCKTRGTCSLADGTAIDSANHLYCVKGLKVYLECAVDADCSEDKTCTNNHCVKTSGGS